MTNGINKPHQSWMEKPVKFGSDRWPLVLLCLCWAAIVAFYLVSLFAPLFRWPA